MKIFLSFLLNALILLEAYRFNDETDKQALLDFKSQVSEVQRTVLSSWNNSLPLCNWKGVTCANEHKRVTRLDLGGLSLRGVISLSIGNLSFLKLLNLESNSFVGKIPREIGNLFRLQSLNMNSNSLSGEIPVSLSNCSRLLNLDLSENLLEHGIPSELGSLTQLTTLDLGQNNLIGNIPTTLPNMSNLRSLRIEYNHLAGPIPPSFGKLKNLQVLSLFGNYLESYSSGNLEFLEALTNCTKLRNLDVGQNRFEGMIPPSIGNFNHLQYLDIKYNKLSGKLPQSLGDCLAMEELYLEGNSFNGSIPDISRLVGLTKIDLSNNNLHGSIPTYLANFSQLQYLDLSFNNLHGKVPTKGIFKDINAFSLFGNKNLCGGIKVLKLKPCSKQALSIGTKHSSHMKNVAIAVSLSLLVMLFISLVSLYWFRKRKKNQTSNAIPYVVGEFHKRISYAELRNATDGFSLDNIIGSGNFGIVFKAILPGDNKVVAVKVLKLQRRGAMKSFLAECESLKDIRHRNLVKLLTVCSRIDSQRNEFRALVYEFMPNGSLDMWLHPEEIEEIEEINWPSRSLTLFERLSIAIDVASAFEYLHVHCHEPIAHCDLKPSNVLLDDDLTAHVSDFGLSRLLLKFDEDSFLNQLSSAGVRGTVGYAAPEYGMGAQPSIHGDVYSFGVLLLEMFTGKRPTNDLFVGSLTLPNYTKSALPERVLDIADKSILDGRFRRGFDVSECLAMILEVGLKCCQESPTNRMTISEAVRELVSIKEKFFRARRTT